MARTVMDMIRNILDLCGQLGGNPCRTSTSFRVSRDKHSRLRQGPCNNNLL